jgi:hypothetical protein
MAVLDKRRRKKLQKKLDVEYGYRNYYDGDVEVARSKCGHGVFAARQFLPGELVMEISGQLVPRKHYAGSDFVMELNKKWSLEPSIPAVFLNHSCTPNCELIQLSKYSLVLVAICNIEAGSEISFDYRWTAHKWIPRCQCGAPNCRGWVVAEDQVKKMEKIAKRKKRRKPR